MKKVGIYIFNDVEVLDFAGPFEVFSTASRVYLNVNPKASPIFDVFTISDKEVRVKARGGLILEPRHTILKHPDIDILLVPGGLVEAETGKADVVEWIAQTSASAELTASICTGAFLIGKAGLLKGKSATTHWEDIPLLSDQLPDTVVVKGVRWIDEGDVVTSGGISAGIDMSLHLVSRLAGNELAVKTARQMEYDWTNQFS